MPICLLRIAVNQNKDSAFMEPTLWGWQASNTKLMNKISYSVSDKCYKDITSVKLFSLLLTIL